MSTKKLRKFRNKDLAPDLTPGENAKVRKACKEADTARHEAIADGKNMEEAFTIWRRIAEAALPGMGPDGKYVGRRVA